MVSLRLLTYCSYLMPPNCMSQYDCSSKILLHLLQPQQIRLIDIHSAFPCSSRMHLGIRIQVWLIYDLRRWEPSVIGSYFSVGVGTFGRRSFPLNLHFSPLQCAHKAKVASLLLDHPSAHHITFCPRAQPDHLTTIQPIPVSAGKTSTDPHHFHSPSEATLSFCFCDLLNLSMLYVDYINCHSLSVRE